MNLPYNSNLNRLVTYSFSTAEAIQKYLFLKLKSVRLSAYRFGSTTTPINGYFAF
jgi:hypothetical protein